MKRYIFNDNRIVIASHNKGKIKEIMVMLKPLKIEVLSAGDFNLKEPIEDGFSFKENALIKSSYVCKNSGIPSLSDDSGICFFDLNNEPGIYSARWAGKEKNFNLAMSKINDSIKKVENPNSPLGGHENLPSIFPDTVTLSPLGQLKDKAHTKKQS